MTLMVALVVHWSSQLVFAQQVPIQHTVTIVQQEFYSKCVRILLGMSVSGAAAGDRDRAGPKFAHHICLGCENQTRSDCELTRCLAKAFRSQFGAGSDPSLGQDPLQHCTCRPPWTGPHCNESVCINGVWSHATNSCVCFEDFTGENCGTKRRCPKTLFWNGSGCVSSTTSTSSSSTTSPPFRTLPSAPNGVNGVTRGNSTQSQGTLVPDNSTASVNYLTAVGEYILSINMADWMIEVCIFVSCALVFVLCCCCVLHRLEQHAERSAHTYDANDYVQPKSIKKKFRSAGSLMARWQRTSQQQQSTPAASASPVRCASVPATTNCNYLNSSSTVATPASVSVSGAAAETEPLRAVSVHQPTRVSMMYPSTHMPQIPSHPI